jgi:HEPN domain-containing protein
MNTGELDVNEWIRIAEQDYESAMKLSGFYPAPLEVICYLCQQAAEKMLKAYVIAKENKLTKTHDLKLLIKNCVQYSPDFDRFGAICSSLSLYSTLTRYPPVLDLVEHDMKQAIKDAQIILEFTKSKLQELGFVPETEPPQN